MTSKTTELVTRLRKYRDAYYNDEPLVEDAVYDALEDDLRRLDPDHPFLSEVGAAPKKMKWEKTPHKMPMTSLNKVNSVSGVAQWVASLSLPTLDVTPTMSWSEKLDGISICLNYERGYLKSAVTRGDGQVGEDIMANAVMMKGVVRELAQPFTGSVRGEIVLTHDMWKTHFPDYSNPRNAASGIAKRESRDKAADCQYLTVMCYDVDANQLPFSDEQEKFLFITSLGFKTPNHGFGQTTDDIDTLYQAYEDSLREDLNYDIDGLVIRLQSQEHFNRAGARGGNPHGAVALKFSAEGSVTVLEDVEWQVGNTGRITPVAVFEPVTLGGAEVRRASLYNQSYIEELGLHLTDEILVVRANDVIPRVVKVVTSVAETRDPRHGCVISPPSLCPECSSPTTRDGEYLVCTGGTACPANRAGLIKQWVDSLGILEWGDFIIDELVSQGMVNDIPDLYRLDPQEIADLRNSNDAVVGMSTATKLLEQLENSSEATLDAIVGGLGISGIRSSSIRKIIGAGYTTPKELMELSLPDVLAVDGFGHKKAAAFVEGMRGRRAILEELLLHQHVRIKSRAAGSLKDKTICLTGSMSKSRAEIKRDIEAQGGIVKSMSSKVDYLVAADPNSSSSKATKARKNGIPIISEEELYELL